MNSVMWWHTIFRDWLLKWRCLYSSLITWIKPQCTTINSIYVVFILNSLFASFFPVQIQKVILSLGDYMQATCHACIGGTNVRSEIHKLSAGAPHIVVGTPGRVYDMLSRGHLSEYLAELMSSTSLAPYPKLKLDCWPPLQVQNISKCLFWMKPMRCWVGGSKIRSTRSFRNWVQTFK